MTKKQLTQDTIINALQSHQKKSKAKEFFLCLIFLDAIVAAYVVYQLIYMEEPIVKNAIIFIIATLILAFAILYIAHLKHKKQTKLINERSFKIIKSKVFSTDTKTIYDPDGPNTTSYYIDFYLFNYDIELSYIATQEFYNSVINRRTNEFYLLVTKNPHGFNLIEIFDTAYYELSEELSDLVEENTSLICDREEN